MATVIEKNTQKLIERKLDALFAKQQALNGNAGARPKMQGGGDYFYNPIFQNPFTESQSYLDARNTYTGPWRRPVPGMPPSWGEPTPQNLPRPTDQNKPVSNNLGIGNNGNGVIPNMATDPRFGAFNQSYESPAFTADTSNLKIPSLGGVTTPGAQNLYNNLENPKLVGTNNKGAVPSPQGMNWGKAGTFAGQVAPMVYNMIKGLQRPEVTRPNYNPYESNVRSLMANRRFNIDPLLTSNRTAQAVSNRNIRSAANSRGELMSNLGASQNYRMAGDAAAWAQKNNMDNEYMAQQAQMDERLGSERARMDYMTQISNQQNKAATNSFLGQGFNDLGRFAQTQQLMSNQAKNSQDLARIYQDMFGGITGFMPELQKILSGYGVNKKAV
jgi:hypothetical protein